MSKMSRHKYQLLATFDENADGNEEIELNNIAKKDNIYKSDTSVLNSATSTWPCKSLLGLLCAFSSCCFFATGSVFTKLCKGSLDALQIVMIRSFVQLLFTIPLIAFYRLPVWENFSLQTRGWLILRGTLGGCSLIAVFYSFQNLPLGDASAIICSSSVYIVFLARVLLKEKIVYLDILVLAAIVAGVILISQPTIIFSKQSTSNASLQNSHYTINSTTQNVKQIQNQLFGLTAAIVASLTIACAHIALRKLPSVHYTIPLFYFSVTGVIVTSITLMIQKNFLIPSHSKYWGYAILVGICGFIGQVFVTKAYQMEKAGPVAIVRQCDIVFAYTFQVVVFDDPLEVISCIGAMLIITGSLVLAIKKLILSTASIRNQVQNCCIYKEL